ncbi:hypothetical protein QQM79_02350 [Marinobacteraceae bacterium S3BR75-40.1]
MAATCFSRLSEKAINLIDLHLKQAMNPASISLFAGALLLASGGVPAAPLNCSYVSQVVPDAEINYMEGEGFVRYELSYQRDDHHWLSTAFEFEKPYTNNPLLKGEEGTQANNLSAHIAENAKKLYLDSMAETGFKASTTTSTGHGQVVTFQPIDPLSANVYGFHARRTETGIQVFRVSGIALSEREASHTELGVEAVVDLIKSCQPNEL